MHILIEFVPTCFFWKPQKNPSFPPSPLLFWSSNPDIEVITLATRLERSMAILLESQLTGVRHHHRKGHFSHEICKGLVHMFFWGSYVFIGLHELQWQWNYKKKDLKHVFWPLVYLCLLFAQVVPVGKKRVAFFFYRTFSTSESWRKPGVDRSIETKDTGDSATATLLQATWCLPLCSKWVGFV